jgi:acyl-CoA synthetase (AMP-forming)/AMP-acid ligase II
VLDTIEKSGVTRVVVWHMRARLEAEAKARGMSLENIKGFGVPPRDEYGHVIPPGRRSNQLGMSETFAQHSAEPAARALPAGKAGASGRGVNGIERRAVDPQTGEEVAPGEVGELQVRGGALMSGLYKVDRGKVFTPDGFYPTNDLVRIDADGYAYFVGRTGDMLKTNSANVSRLEVQAAMESLDEVELALVAGLPDDELGQVIVAAVVPRPGTTVTEDGLRTALREQLSSFKIPRRIVLIGHGDVPRTTTGKVRLFDLSELIKSRM